MLRTDLLAFGVAGAVFRIAREMRRLPAYFDNPGSWKTWKVLEFYCGTFHDWKVLEKDYRSWKVLEIC